MKKDKNNNLNKIKKIIFLQKVFDLKPIKTINSINDKIENIYFFKNKNYLVKGLRTYKIYNEKFKIVKNIQIKDYLNFIKIIDNNNFICLKNKKQLINVNIKNVKKELIFDFMKEIGKILYYKNKCITLEEYNNEIKIWEFLKDRKLQLNAKIKLKDIINIFLIPKIKNIVISGNKVDITYFFNLKTLKFENKITYRLKDLYRLNHNLFIFTNFYYNKYYQYEEGDSLDIYNLYEKKITKSIKIDFLINSILTIPKRRIFLASAYFINDIYVFDYHFNQIQSLIKIHNEKIVGMKLYEKSEKNDLVLSYSEDGQIKFFIF